MPKKRIFISYDYTNDKKYKNLLLAWDQNNDFDFGFYDMSVDVSVDSNNAAAIKRAISAKISDSTYFLCLVGKQTSKSKWITWEINKAVELKKNIVAVKIEKENDNPLSLYGVSATWALSFNFDAIKKAVEEA